MQNTYELANQRVGKAPFTRVVSTTSANHRQREYNLREKINKMRILSENDDKKYQFYLTVEMVLEPTHESRRLTCCTSIVIFGFTPLNCYWVSFQLLGSFLKVHSLV